MKTSLFVLPLLLAASSAYAEPITIHEAEQKVNELRETADQNRATEKGISDEIDRTKAQLNLFERLLKPRRGQREEDHKDAYRSAEEAREEITEKKVVETLLKKWRQDGEAPWLRTLPWKLTRKDLMQNYKKNALPGGTAHYHFVHDNLPKQLEHQKELLKDARAKTRATLQSLVEAEQELLNALGKKAQEKEMADLVNQSNARIGAYKDSLKNLSLKELEDRAKQLKEDHEGPSIADQMKEILAALKKQKLTENMSDAKKRDVRQERGRLLARLAWLSHQSTASGFNLLGAREYDLKRKAIEDRSTAAIREGYVNLIKRLQHNKEVLRKRRACMEWAFKYLKELNVIQEDASLESMFKNLDSDFTVDGMTNGNLTTETKEELDKLMSSPDRARNWLTALEQGNEVAGELHKIPGVKSLGLIQQLADVSLNGMLVLYKGLLIKQNMLTPGKPEYRPYQLEQWLKEKGLRGDSTKILYEMEHLMGIEDRDKREIPGAHTKAYWSRDQKYCQPPPN